MIRVDRKPLPDEARRKYEVKVLGPGLAWLDAHPAPRASTPEAPRNQERPPDYWREIREELADAFHERCAYTAMWLSYPGQVDHFVSIDEDRARAYEWDNFRYCAGWLNSSKQGIRSSRILDPLEIEDDWFEISLPSLELGVTDRCPEPLRERAEFMLDRLHLRKGPQVIRYRRQFYQQYRPGEPRTLELLDQWAPLIARAIRKQEAQHAAGAEPPRP